MKEQQEPLELFGGTGAAQAAGYETLAGFRKALARWPIPDQGYRYNGKPVWTREHLVAWRESVPSPGWPATGQ